MSEPHSNGESEALKFAQHLSPNKSGMLAPSPIVTRRTRTNSTSALAFKNPQISGIVKYFCKSKGHGFITPNNGDPDTFVHISDIEGEFVPLPGDHVRYRLCPIPPKLEKNQAVHVEIVNLTPQVHLKWDSPEIAE